MRLRLLPKVTVVRTQEDAVRVLEYLMKRGGPIAIDTETNGLDIMRCRVLCWSMATEDQRYFIPYEYLLLFDPLFLRIDITWYLANAKFDLHMLANMGVTILGPVWDIIVADAMDDDTRRHGLKDQSYIHYGAKWGDFKELFLDPAYVSKALGLEASSFTRFRNMDVGEKLLFVWNERPEIVENYASCDAFFTYMRAEDLKNQLAAQSLATEMVPGFTTQLDYFTVIEVPFTKVLWHMERTGFPLDLEYAKSIDIPMREGIRARELAIKQFAGPTYNPNSRDDLRDLLFSKKGFNLTPVKYSKGNTPTASTGEKELEVLRDRLKHNQKAYDFLTAQLEYGHLQKLHGTFVKKADKHLGPDGRVHPRYNQTGARTGRLSCVAAWTPVTVHGSYAPVPICRLNPGDQVWTHKERWRTVLQRFTKGFDHMYDLRLSNGEVLTCTADHKLQLSDGRWAPTGWIINEYLKTLGQQPGKSEGSAVALPVLGDADVQADCPEAWDDLPQRVRSLAAVHAARGAGHASEDTVLGLENGRQKPNEGKGGRSAPQLEGLLPGRQRVLHLSIRGEAPVRSPRSYGESTGPERDPQLLCGSSHRRGSLEQRSEQPGASYAGRASHYSLSAGEGLPAVEVEEIHYRGCLEVYDITVAEDASYEACGVISHNCTDPNLQQIPIRKDEFKIRGMFVSPEDESMTDCDYPQIQPRLAAVLAPEPKMIEAIEAGWDIHSANAYNMYHKRDASITYAAIEAAKKKKDDRTEALNDFEKSLLRFRDGAKTVGLGVLFGEGPTKMAHQLKLAGGRDEAMELIQNFFTTYPGIQSLIYSSHDYAHEHGFMYTMLGRARRFHRINNPYNQGVVAAEERQAFNHLIQGSEVEIMKLAMLQLHHNKDFQDLGGKLAGVIHDELISFGPDENIADILEVQKTIMADPLNWGPIRLKLPVPVDPDGAYGKRWSLVH